MKKPFDEKRREQFIKYVKGIISLTFGFEPQIRTEAVNQFTLQVFLDGTEQERKIMMGRNARNFRFLKDVVKFYGDYYETNTFLYIEYPDDYKENIEKYQNASHRTKTEENIT